MSSTRQSDLLFNLLDRANNHDNYDSSMDIRGARSALGRTYNYPMSLANKQSFELDGLDVSDYDNQSRLIET
jgi:hypothetical protein